jgi:hypothetical protein
VLRNITLRFGRTITPILEGRTEAVGFSLVCLGQSFVINFVVMAVSTQ